MTERGNGGWPGNCARTGIDINVSPSSMQLVLLLIKLQICGRGGEEEEVFVPAKQVFFCQFF